MNKRLANILSFFIPSRALRRRWRTYLLGTHFPENAETKTCANQWTYIPGFYEQEDFVYTFGNYNMGLSWVEYLLSNNMPEKVDLLRRGMDEKSQKVVDQLFAGLTILPPARWFGANFMVRKSILKEFNTEQEIAYQEEHYNRIEEYRASYRLDEDVRSFTCFTHHSGLRDKSDKLKKYISGSDVLEGGPYIGAATLIFKKIYHANHIYSFELSPRTRERYLSTMQRNGMRPDDYTLVPMGLAETQKRITISDSGYMGTNINDFGNTDVSVIDIDTFVEKSPKKINIGFIVSDVEGAGLNVLKGMVKTIQTYRPVLSLSIYHSPLEFFEMKPLLDAIVTDLDYKITIEKQNPLHPQIMTPILFAYPRELN